MVTSLSPRSVAGLISWRFTLPFTIQWLRFFIWGVSAPFLIGRLFSHPPALKGCAFKVLFYGGGVTDSLRGVTFWVGGYGKISDREKGFG